ncbi:2Fe-2S iron-sulfur cluster-binding protein [Bdellovibrio bacteriovorus]|uniref:2Fe-2S iron-sulfur cluster-binding protein n=1 Tax=Bdellovibrio bacteriovorus TaxID=959 RepID=UPI0021CE2587|nr:2Fe-2S iron-sulfur cluster-binding protein [Bdellovibrio bacteriovorus]UXR65081.1 2Fe-2S iron-sulfur cluster-binding protein [Bdellovibrio bacteriovorus]
MKIKFLPQNIEVEGTPNKSLLQIATENKIEIRSICKGVPSCAECRVRIKEGDSNILPPNKAELNLIGTSHFIDGRRLSCQVHCYGDVTVDLTEQVERIENQTKKIRGFRANKHIESKAVNDTMLLSEKPEDKLTPDKVQAQPSQPSGTEEKRPQQQQQHQQQKQQQNKPKQQQNQQKAQSGKNQNQNKNQGGQPKQQPQKQQQQQQDRKPQK